MKLRLGFWSRQWFYFKLSWERLDWDAFGQDIVRGAPIYVLAAFAALLIVIVAGVFNKALGGATGLLAPFVAALALFVYRALGHFAKVFGPIEAKLAEYRREPDYRRRVGFLKEFETDLARIVTLVTNNGRWPLVVFIDDLDRCAPPKPVVEAINLLLGVKDCIFVIGMDSRAVAASIEAKYRALGDGADAKDDGSGHSLGRRFLEKIVQVYFRIPPPDPDTFDGFLKGILAGTRRKKSPIEPGQKRAGEDTKQRVAEDLIRAEQRAGKGIQEAVSRVRDGRKDLGEDAVRGAEQALVSGGTEGIREGVEPPARRQAD